jgi:hypothetical protein
MGFKGGPTELRSGLFVLTEVPKPPAERNSRDTLYVNGEAVWKGPVRVGPLQVTEAKQDLADRKTATWTAS